MDAARHQRVRDLLHQAAERPPEDRRAWLEAACGGDADLVRRVLSLLDATPVATPDLLPRGLVPLPPPVHLAPGTVLSRWRLRREIGRGGMGVVYEAEDVATGGTVALKVLRPDLLSHPGLRERFLREARLGLGIVHDNVARTLDVGEAVVGEVTLHFLVMERLEGRTLRVVLDASGPLPEARAVDVLCQSACGLAALHDAGVVHRDVKPENLWIDRRERVRIMDLGVAKPLAAGPALTAAGQFVGSPRYASPEQVLGEEVGPAADLWALGAVAHEMLTGAPPPATTPEPGVAPVPSAVPLLADRPPRASAFLGAVVTTLLERRPQDRFASAHHLETVLAEGEGSVWWSLRRRRPRR